MALVSTPEGVTNKSPMSPGPSVTVKNTIARKPVRQFTELLDVKNKTAVHWLGDPKSKRKET